jgi:hypothetical protein
MPAPVSLVTVHHEGAGAPTDNVGRFAEGGYTYGIGVGSWARFRSVWDSYGTLNYNGESVDVCLSGNRMEYPVTDRDLDIIASALGDARAHGYVVTVPEVRAHRDSPGSGTVCPGDLTMNRWPEIVAACNGARPAEPETTNPEKGGAVEIVETPSGNGYYVVDSTGAVFAYGDAQYHGGANTLNGGKGPNEPITSMAVRPQNDGYWLLGADGGVFAYGKAPFKGAPTGKVH